ncbi:MAG: electron transfer flavoprotein subunit beta/FixA family protein [Deltaproteobacteria bacterium]|nr:electron transfer flavoprotein subunit beta/FixA family protein [Deltaproteobacteria bacterium]
MEANILVCVKQVPEPGHFQHLRLDKGTGTLIRSGIPLVLNPLDKHALEAALAIKDAYGATITAITMGPPSVKKVIEGALALGVDEGVLLSDSAFAGSDTLATAKIIARAISLSGNYDLILCGDESVDGATRQVPVQLAVLLGIPYVTAVKGFSFSGNGALSVEKKIGGDTAVLEVKTPALLALTKGINQPRLPTIAGIIATKNKKIRELTALECFGSPPNNQISTTAVPASPTEVFSLGIMAPRKGASMIDGSLEKTTKELAKILQSRCHK